MGQETGIGWTDHTFNPWWGCLKVSPGCENCYAEFLAVTRRKLPVWGPASTTDRKRTTQPWKDLPKWNAAAIRDGVRRRVFVASMADIFEDHPMVTEWRAEALALLERCTGLDVQLLTKRPENIRRMVPASWLTSWPDHVWIGTTVEDQARAEKRIPLLLNVPARVRFLSVEPLLEAVDLRRYLGGMARHEVEGHAANCDGSCFDLPAVSWVIVGGESGYNARPFRQEWAASIAGQCVAADVPVFVKQMGSNPHNGPAPLKLRDRAGADPSEWPSMLRRQEFPR